MVRWNGIHDINRTDNFHIQPKRPTLFDFLRGKERGHSLNKTNQWQSKHGNLKIHRGQIWFLRTHLNFFSDVSPGCNCLKNRNFKDNFFFNYLINGIWRRIFPHILNSLKWVSWIIDSRLHLIFHRLGRKSFVLQVAFGFVCLLVSA